MQVYIYPTYTPSRDKSGNLYIKYFHDAFKDSHSWTLVNRLWKIGVASILFNLDAEVFIIHWVDLIPFKRFGRVQFLFFIFCISVLKFFGKKVVWVLHNKHAHNGKSKMVDWGMLLMARMATKVIAHSEEGVTFFDKKYFKFKGKCYYIPHPVYSADLVSTKEVRWDYIIWGTINRRKRLLEFLDYANTQPFYVNKKILVCGYCRDYEYSCQISQCCGLNIDFINKFLTDEEISYYIRQSRVILFTYNTESVLSSGALIYSLNFNKPIIGPNAGSFADLKEFVSCYETFEDIEHLSLKSDPASLKAYINENSWNKLPRKIMILLE